MNKRTIAAVVAVAGLGAGAQGQAVLRFLVSPDGGATWSNSYSAFQPGVHLDIMATLSYTGSSPSILGFSAANFQPVISGWRTAGTPDHLSPIMAGGNVIGGMVQPQSSAVGLGSPNPYLTPTPGGAGGTPVPSGPYVAGTYGRVSPMGQTPLTGGDALTSFVHVNPPPDQTGHTYPAGTYLRIAKASNPDWFNATTNNLGTGGVELGQAFVTGRTTSDPDFWGARDLAYDPGDPANGIPESWSPGPNGHNERRTNIQLFRFHIDMSPDQTDPPRTMIIDAPLAGQMLNAAGTDRGVSFYSGTSSVTEFGIGGGSLTVVPLFLNDIIPAPGTLGVGAVCVMVAARRRRAPSGQLSLT